MRCVCGCGWGEELMDRGKVCGILLLGLKREDWERSGVGEGDYIKGGSTFSGAVIECLGMYLVLWFLF